eukprot:6043060-Pyramimonas_sp.AAC.1
MAGNSGGRARWRIRYVGWGTARRSARACLGGCRWPRGCPWFWVITWVGRRSSFCGGARRRSMD